MAKACRATTLAGRISATGQPARLSIRQTPAQGRWDLGPTGRVRDRLIELLDGGRRAQHNVDRVLLDVMMPKLDGISVLKELKGDTSLRYIPVILVTAKADTRDIVRGLEAGGDDYLTEPFEQAALLARVRSLLRIKELHDTAQLKAAQLQRQTEQLSSWNRSLEERSQRLAAKEIAPNVRRMGFMFHPQIEFHYRAYMRELGTAAASLAAEFSPMPVRDGAEIEAAVTALAQEPGGGLIVANGPIHQHPTSVDCGNGGAASAARNLRLPAVRQGGGCLDLLWTRQRR